MAQWQVVAAPIELFPHPKSDKLQVGKVGPFQVVVSKDNGYENGQVVIFAPERSILPEEIRSNYVNTMTGVSYLVGDNKDRVKSVRLLGELSEGVTISLDWARPKLTENCVMAQGGVLPYNRDLSTGLGITKYKAPIPEAMLGALTEAPFMRFVKKHDVEQFRIYQREFTVGEHVNLFEKIHGSQVSIYLTEEGETVVSSKSSTDDGHCYVANGNKPSESVLYWKAVFNVGMLKHLEQFIGKHEVQIFAEVFPCQKGGFTYGATEPTLLIYRICIDGKEVPHETVCTHPSLQWFKDHWVPLIWSGPYPENVEEIFDKVKGKEIVSGNSVHVSEGGVLSPVMPRHSSEGFPLYTKIINPKFKGSDEDLS